MLNQFVQCKDPDGHLRFEFGVTDKNYNRMNCTRRHKIQQLLHGLNVGVVLTRWILEFELGAEKNLRPSDLVSIGKYPTFVVLGLDHKNAKA